MLSRNVARTKKTPPAKKTTTNQPSGISAAKPRLAFLDGERLTATVAHLMAYHNTTLRKMEKKSTYLYVVKLKWSSSYYIHTEDSWLHPSISLKLSLQCTVLARLRARTPLDQTSSVGILSWVSLCASQIRRWTFSKAKKNHETKDRLFDEHFIQWLESRKV